MKSLSENLRECAGELEVALTELIRDHSEVYRWNPPGSTLVTLSGDFAWRRLQPEGKRLQSRLLGEYRHFRTLLTALVGNRSKEELASIEEHHKTVLQTIEQTSSFCSENKTDELESAISALRNLSALIDPSYDSNASEVILIPDTNALLYNPSLESWTYDAIPEFTVALTTVVLSELDALGPDHPNRTVREKAGNLVRQIKEYRKKGRLSGGVPLKEGRSTLKTFAKEPDIEKSLPWLRETNRNDRFLASALEIMREYVGSKVLLVSREISVQSKAEFARLPFLEPPEPRENR